MLRLKCPAQNYAWGRPAEESEVAQLAKANGVDIDESKPFAELWMGTHPSGPALLADASGDAAATTTLRDWLGKHPEALGAAVARRFGAAAGLPYLFKVLSVRTALSIQSHPDKALAERLHASNPKEYKDDNHKPEMALALADFSALCGFAPPAEVKAALRDHGELRLVVGDAAADALLAAEGGAFKPALKAAFTALMTAEPEPVAAAIAALVKRVEADKAGGRALAPKEALVLTLNEQYPGDVGVLSALFLNYITLQPGEAVYLAANEPHAYVSGELVECMATSDNVIRAGLTPKFRDTEALCGSLTYATGAPEVLRGERVHDHVLAYRPPFDEFEVQRVDVPAGAEGVAVPANPGPVLLLVTGGAGSAEAAAGGAADGADGLVNKLELRRGAVVFVPAGAQLTFSAAAGAGGPLTVWVAAVNARVFAPAAVPAAAEAAAAAPEPALAAA